jgi:hypothetical protein
MRVAVHNHYEFITTDGYLFKNQNSDIGHNLLKSWNDLYKLCKSTGIELYTLDQVDPHIVDLVIYMDRPRVEPDVPGASKVLILYEPPLILPDNWDEAYHDQFSRVLTWDDRLTIKKKYEKHNFTVDWNDRWPCEKSRGDFFTHKLAVMIQTAKNIPGSLYEKRIELIQWFKDNAIFDLDLYGRGWDIRTHPVLQRTRPINKLANLQPITTLPSRSRTPTRTLDTSARRSWTPSWPASCLCTGVRLTSTTISRPSATSTCGSSSRTRSCTTSCGRWTTPRTAGTWRR